MKHSTYSSNNNNNHDYDHYENADAVGGGLLFGRKLSSITHALWTNFTFINEWKILDWKWMIRASHNQPSDTEWYSNEAAVAETRNYDI